MRRVHCRASAPETGSHPIPGALQPHFAGASREDSLGEGWLLGFQILQYERRCSRPETQERIGRRTKGEDWYQEDHVEEQYSSWLSSVWRDSSWCSSTWQSPQQESPQLGALVAPIEALQSTMAAIILEVQRLSRANPPQPEVSTLAVPVTPMAARVPAPGPTQRTATSAFGVQQEPRSRSPKGLWPRFSRGWGGRNDPMAFDDGATDAHLRFFWLGLLHKNLKLISMP